MDLQDVEKVASCMSIIPFLRSCSDYWLLLEHLNQVLLVFNVQVKIYTITQKVIFIYLFTYCFGGGMFYTALAEIPVCSPLVLQDFGVYSAVSTNLSWKRFNFVTPWPANTAISLRSFDITMLRSHWGMSKER